MNLQTPSSRKYIDIRNDFSRHPISNDVITVTGEDSIKQCLANLIMLERNEKPFHPEIASGVHQYLFEPMNGVTTTLIEKAIESVINNYEPRVDLVGVVASPDEDKNAYEILLVYTIVNSPQPVQVQELGFFIERKR